MAQVLVTGAAGFVGSHLCRALLDRGDTVIGVDNLSTGSERNLATLTDHNRFRFSQADITAGLHHVPISGRLDAVLNLASPASPPRYLARPIETLRVGSVGTEVALRLALAHGARFLQASTSEVYGDPLEHPQREDYWGHVNPVGPRSVYDEAKRYGEALTMAFARAEGLEVRIARIFNTYGPHLDPADGRVVSNLLAQALTGQPLTIYGDGTQTRAFCYVDDLVRGLVALLDGPIPGPVNLGNPNEFTMLELADVVRQVTGATSEVVFEPLPADDPMQRRPDITLARTQLGWEPEVLLPEGLERTAAWYRQVMRIGV